MATARAFARLLLFVFFASSALIAAQPPATPWKVGVATRKLTPEGPIWLAGYASRAKPSDGVLQDVFAKALAIDDGKGGRVVMVTLDLIGVPHSLRVLVEREGRRRFGLEPAEILLNASHTHSGPQVSPDRMVLERAFSRAAKREDVEAVNRFATFLEQAVVEVIGESLGAMAPGRLEFSQARAGFAMNRRRPGPDGTFSNNPHPDGPVDHDVPVLKVTAPDGKIRALLFGYACHNTTLSGSTVSGDYAGFAQQYLESSYAGATALFMMGCGGDQNPYPRRGMVPDRPVEDLARDHGRALANAVSTALAAVPRPVRGPLRGAFDRATLAYQPLTAEVLAKYRAPEHTPPVIQRAQALMRKLESRETPEPLRCPVQVVQFGDDLTLIAIGGEVVVDYALRLKKELQGSAAVWVAGYSNDIFGYLGSRRVIEEGGYEGGGANIRILNHPGPFTPEAEDVVIGKVHELRRKLRQNP
jgi:hypothetical protein